MTITNFDEFTDSVRDALTHLYDHVHLQTHPLGVLVNDQAGLDQITRAQKLRRRLLEAVEQLNPAAGGPTTPESSFSYSALSYRYMDGLSPEEIANMLGISSRQVYRKLKEGVEAVASLLWDQFQPGSGKAAADNPPPDTWDRQSLAEATVKQLSSMAHPEMLEIQGVLAGILKDLQPYHRQIGLKIDPPPPAAPLHIYADRAMIRQALLNLLTKGFDRLRPKAIGVELKPSANRLNLIFHAKIEGTPLPTAPLGEPERIGWQVGVQLIELQGGRVTHITHSTAWRIEITMPLVEPQRVLVIDDMPDIIDMFRRFTARYTLEVVGAKNGAAAFEVLKIFTPSLILLDVMLPAQDGWEILQTLKSNPATAQIPVVICSILNEPGLAAAIGANGYLRKPVNQEVLLEELSHWLQLTPVPAAAPQ